LIIAVGDDPVMDIGDYLDIRMGMQSEACVWGNLVIVQDDEIPQRLVGFISIGSYGEMMSSPEPPSGPRLRSH
jgi:hypothetical protein